MKKVKIKTWEKMEKEFGIDYAGGEICIKCYGFFCKNMEKAMPDDRIIEVDDKEDDFYRFNDWYISDDMIEEVIK